MPSPSVVLLRTQSDARLVTLARDGSEAAFEAIVDRYRKPLLRACRRVLSEARAEDALQQALLAAWKGLQRGDEVRELRPWLYRIAHNTSLNQLRVSGYDFDELQESLRITDGSDEELERRAVVRETLAGLANLPERQREALLAIAVEGRSQDEVAEVLGLSPGAVRQLVHRARTQLRAAATALTPFPVASWIAAWAARGEPMASRIAEMTAGAGGAGAAAVLAKAGTVLVIGGAAVGGPVIAERHSDHHAKPKAATTAPAKRASRQLSAHAPSSPDNAPANQPASPSRRVSGDGTAALGDDRSGRRRPDRDGDDDSSGKGSGGSDDDNSGKGPSGSGDGSSGSSGSSDSSGSGSSGSSGSGSSGSSGSGSSGSSGSGSSGSSGSGSSGFSGSGSSGSSGSGSSGSSGSGSSGSSGSGSSGSSGSGSSGSSGSGSSGSGSTPGGSGSSGSSGGSGSTSGGSGSSESSGGSGSTSGGSGSSGSSSGSGSTSGGSGSSGSSGGSGSSDPDDDGGDDDGSSEDFSQ
jgi:RNA polymerase sigma factor (sigma-70 family)